jgi:FtsZ-binding cell division protein ZapB
MTCGIYCLTFRDGSRYVGKSINIERRWLEHIDKMRNAKAAKNMQYAYDTCGTPAGKILLECHSDHIDIMETYFISKVQPNLNAVGGIAVTSPDLDILEEHAELLEHSTADHIRGMVLYQQKLDNLTKEYKSLEKLIDAKKLEHSLQNDITGLGLEIDDLNDENVRLEDEADELRDKVKELEERLNKRKSLWNRIFSW